MSREAIYSALFAKVGSASGFMTIGRKLQHWADVAPAEQPALFQVQKSEDVKPQTGMPSKVLMHVELYIYNLSTADPYASPAIGLNKLMDAVTAALSPMGGATEQTLGGLVSYCRINGQINTDEGVLGDQAVAIIPIEILANI